MSAHLDDPMVRLVEVDVSGADYGKGHIPGALLWNAYTDLRDDAYRAVETSELARLLSRGGVTAEHTVVCYGYGAALGFWLLQARGHEHVRMLPGARRVWERAGHEWSTDIPEFGQAPLRDLIEDRDLIASRRDVESALAGSGDVLLDVRSEAEYRGERFWPSGATEGAGGAGHLPGAINLPIDRLRTDDDVLKSADELRRVFAQAGITKDRNVIVYCTIGNRAAQAWFALKYLLDYPSVRVYYGSWVEWGLTADTPIEK